MKKLWLNFWFTLAIIILISTGLFMYMFSQTIVNENKDISSLTVQFELLEELQIQIRTAIIQHHGFLLTDDIRYLEKYEQSRNITKKHLQELKQALDSKFISETDIDSAEFLLDQNYKYLDSLIINKANIARRGFNKEIELYSSQLYFHLARLNSNIEQRLKARYRLFRQNVLIRAVFLKFINISIYSLALIILIISFTGLHNQIRYRIKAEEKLKESNKMKDKFFSIVAHDLRAPFNVLINISSLMSEVHKPDKSRLMKELAKQVETVSIRTFNLLNNLLDWANSQTGVLKMHPEPLNLKDITVEIVNLYDARIKEKSLRIDSFDQEVEIRADRQMIHTVIRNLLGNATKFTPIGGAIRIAVSENSDEIEYSVSDTGPGLRQEEIKKLFRIDEDSRKIGNSKEKGSGLGLILCKEFIDKHNGRINVRLNPNKGSTFYFTLPKL